MDAILARLKEPSTWAGVAAILLAVGKAFPHAAGVTDALAVVLGGGAVAGSEGAAAQKPLTGYSSINPPEKST